ncbi:MAG TPA: hypothetical protein VHE35_31270 [Kofleriaceae bacterium]|nr:hypothetical protein [Kofleriaceae bacterium]
MTLVGSASLSPGAGFSVVPGLSTTINVPAGAKVLLSADGGVQTSSNNGSAYSVVDLALSVDGSLLPGGAGYRRVTAANTNFSLGTATSFAMTAALSVPAGNHTFSVAAALHTGSTATVSGDSQSPLQGDFTIVILKQ